MPACDGGNCDSADGLMFPLLLLGLSLVDSWFKAVANEDVALPTSRSVSDNPLRYSDRLGLPLVNLLRPGEVRVFLRSPSLTLLNVPLAKCSEIICRQEILKVSCIPAGSICLFFWLLPQFVH
jgi:hypothetical protein